MNINVSVTVFPAPGLSIGRQQAVTNAIGLFRGKTFPVTNISSTTPVGLLNLLTNITTSVNAPQEVLQNLVLLRVLINGHELNMMQSLTENGITNNNLLNVHLIAK